MGTRKTHRSRSTRLGAVAAGLVLALGVTACGDDSGGAGSAPDPVAAIDSLSGGTTAIALDKDFTGALADLGLEAGVTGTAKLTDKGSLVFPITGGNVTVFTPGEVSPYVIGQIQHVGSGFTLSAGGTTVRLSSLNVDPGASRVYGDVAVDGKEVAPSAYLFQLDGRTLEPIEPADGKAVLTGTRVKISPVAASLLNKTFDTKAVKAGLLVGIATITVDTKSKG